MKPFSNNHALRCTALVTMLVWLFALASGMANACLLEAPGTHGEATRHAHADAKRGAAGLTDAAMADGDHDDPVASSKEACLKTCDDGSNAPVKLKASMGLSEPGLSPFVAIAWIAATPAVSAISRVIDLQPPILGPPLRVRYSRLTL